MLTLFTTPKPFAKHIGLIQHNAIGSWRSMPDVEILLMGDDEGTAAAAKSHGVRHIPNIARNPWGTPLVADLFKKADHAARGTAMCYCNGDILLPSALTEIVAEVAARHPRYILVGRRWDVDIDRPIRFAPGWEAEIRAHAHQNGRLHPATGIDYFIYPRGMLADALPPFSVGRIRWDNWLLFYARLLDIPVIDATGTIECWHQNHDYAHIPRDTVDHIDTDEQRFSKMLAFDAFFLFTLEDCSHVLRGGEVVTAPSVGRTPRRPDVVSLANGTRWMMVPGSLSPALAAGAYRPGLFTALNTLLKPGMVFLDVGAHHGAVTLAARHLVGPSGQVFAVEPSVRELMVLRMQLALNRIDDVTVLPCALTDRPGRGSFHINRSLENERNAIEAPRDMLRGRRVEVEMDTIDAVAAAASRAIDVIKIDLVDAEPALLAGASATLVPGGIRPLLLLSAAWDQPGIRALLTAAGYHTLVRRDGRFVSWDGAGPLPDTLVACPEERRHALG